MNNETPKLAVDCIVLTPGSTSNKREIVLIERKNPPLGYALPGGFVDIGETTEKAARREIKEELNVDIGYISQLGVYDDPSRDPRQHVVSVVYVGTTDQKPIAGDDAKNTFIWNGLFETLPKMVFDHEKILRDFFVSNHVDMMNFKFGGRLPVEV